MALTYPAPLTLHPLPCTPYPAPLTLHNHPALPLCTTKIAPALPPSHRLYRGFCPPPPPPNSSPYLPYTGRPTLAGGRPASHTLRPQWGVLYARVASGAAVDFPKNYSVPGPQIKKIKKTRPQPTLHLPCTAPDLPTGRRPLPRNLPQQTRPPALPCTSYPVHPSPGGARRPTLTCTSGSVDNLPWSSHPVLPARRVFALYLPCTHHPPHENSPCARRPFSTNFKCLTRLPCTADPQTVESHARLSSREPASPAATPFLTLHLPPSCARDPGRRLLSMTKSETLSDQPTLHQASTMAETPPRGARLPTANQTQQPSSPPTAP